MRRRAFTLFELMLAMVISTLLVGGILVVVTGLAGDRRRLAAEASVSPTDGLSALLCRDLAGALAPPTSASNMITFRTHHALHPSTLEPTGRLCEVRYRVNNGQLLREQLLLDDPVAKAGPPTRQLLMADVGTFSLLPSSGASRYRVHLQQLQQKAVTFDIQVR